MASLTEPLCTCPAYWRGTGERPPCTVHPEREAARRRVASLLAANRRGGHRDPEGMTPDVPWRPWP